MKLCLAEKPSVAREIARVLGANTKRDGYYEGQGYQVSWTFGHLCTLKTPDDYTPEWKWWKLHSLPMIPQRFGIKLIDNPGIEKQFNKPLWTSTICSHAPCAFDGMQCDRSNQII
jgi:DNA topoisomerase-3